MWKSKVMSRLVDRWYPHWKYRHSAYLSVQFLWFVMQINALIAGVTVHSLIHMSLNERTSILPFTVNQ